MAELIVTLKSREVQRFPITSHAVYIGRSPHCDLILPNESVSREHASLSVTVRGFSVQPLSETNSLWLNGKMCAKATALVDGDVMQVGKYLITLSAKTGPSLSVLQAIDFASDFEISTHTTALAIDDLERYREATPRPQEPRSLEEIRQARVNALTRQLSYTRVALLLSALLNAWLLWAAWRGNLSLY